MGITQKEEKIIKRVIENKDFEPYFFEKIIENKDIKWFKILKSNGFFDVENIPKSNKNEYIEKWYLLEYIKCILMYQQDCMTYSDINEIKYLLKDISTNKYINFKVFQQCLEILYLMKGNLYDNEYLEMILNNFMFINLDINMNIILNVLNFICKLIDKEEFVKSMCVFNIVMNYMISNNIESEFLFDELNEHMELLSKNYHEELMKNIIQIIESYLEVNSSEEYIENNKIEIKLNKQSYEILINEKSVLTNEFVDRYSDIEKINKSIQLNILDNKQKIDEVTKLLYGHLFSKESLKSLYSDEFYEIRAFDYLVYLAKKIIQNYYNDKKIVKIIINMIKNKYDFIIKIGLYGMSYLINQNNELFDSVLESNKENFEYIIGYHIFDEDIKYLFNHLTSINQNSITLIESIIDKGEYINFNFGKEFDDIWKQKRYKALSNIQYFNDKFQSIKKKTNVDVDLKPCISPIEPYIIEDTSVISCNDIKHMSNEELIKKMKLFRPKIDFNKNKEISYKGFGRELKKAIIQEFERFYPNLDMFKDIPNEFMVSMIDAFEELTINNKISKCENIILLFLKNIERNEFWEEVDENRYGYKVILNSIFRYLEIYLNNENLEFNEEIFNNIMKILEICCENINYENDEQKIINNNDYLFYILNNLSPLNIRVLISLALKIKRIKMDNIDKLLNLYYKLSYKCPKNLYLIIGYFIPQLTYIDKEFVKEKMETDFKYKEYFIIGYLLNSNIYEEYFKIMKLDYINYMQKNYNDPNIKKGLVGHIVISYFNKFECGKELIDTLMEKSDDNILLNIINFCKRIKVEDLINNVTYDDYTKNLMYIWNAINKILNDKKYKNEDKIMKEMTKFISKFEAVDDDIKLNIEKSFLYMSDDFYTYSFVHYLITREENLKNKNIDLLNIIKSFLYISAPIYPDNEIKQLVDYINRFDNEYMMNIYNSYLEKNKEYTRVGSYIRDIIRK